MLATDLLQCRSLVVVSPHLDDAALSCGALLVACAELGVTATVVTVFDGGPRVALSRLATELHRRCGLGVDPMATRVAEDVRAMSLLGAASARLGMPEALYRVTASGQHRFANTEDIFTASVDDEAELVASVAARMISLNSVAEADLLFAPIGVGGHIDHRIVAAATRRMGRQADSVLWYEEVPYILLSHYKGWLDQIRPRHPKVCKFSPRQWHVKLAAIDCYQSQHPILWDEPTRWRSALTDHAKTLGGGITAERYWSHGR